MRASNQLTTIFTAATDRVTVYLHGWYGQPAYHAGNVVLDGPGGSGPPPDTTVPAVPATLGVGQPTSSSLRLTWSASTDNVGVDQTPSRTGRFHRAVPVVGIPAIPAVGIRSRR
jgi:hypothetical protein